MNSAYLQEIKEATLFQRMRCYWRIFHSNHYYRFELLHYLEKYIRRQLPKKIFPLKVRLHGVGKKKIRFNPRA